MSKSVSIPSQSVLSQEIIERKILLIRGKKVMLDRDLASLYGVDTRALNRSVLRNPLRFPEEFMFQLTDQEFKNLMYHFGTSSWGGSRKRSNAFTEHGILMLSSVLHSRRAILVNIEIMKAFVRFRELMLTHRELREKIDQMEKKYDSQFKVVFETLKELLEPPINPNKRPIGFHT